MRNGLVDVCGIPVQSGSEFLGIGTTRNAAQYDGDREGHHQPDGYTDEDSKHMVFLAPISENARRN
ncbi:hypothetical protein ABIB34_000707 [Rhodococcus sp. UYP5]